MPTDTKRVRGPEVSHSPSLFLTKAAVDVQNHGPRADGRQRDQVDVRPVFVRCGLVSQAKGSAYIEAGRTKLMCCVYGPKETDRKDETDMKFGRFVCVCLRYIYRSYQSQKYQMHTALFRGLGVVCAVSMADGFSKYGVGLSADLLQEMKR